MTVRDTTTFDELLVVIVLGLVLMRAVTLFTSSENHKVQTPWGAYAEKAK